MLEFLLRTENLPFAVALAVMLGIAALEGVASLLGAGISQFLDSLLPDFDLDLDLEVDADADVDAHTHLPLEHGGLTGAMTQALGWLRVGEVPILVLLVILLTAFGLIGLGVQNLVVAATGGWLLPPLLAAVPAFVLALPVVRVTGGWLARLLPKEETSAVSRNTFVGRVAVIVLGTASSGSPAEARLQDAHGRTHYVMVLPDVEGEEFPTGSEVLLVRLEGPRFRVIRAPAPLMANAAND